VFERVVQLHSQSVEQKPMRHCNVATAATRISGGDGGGRGGGGGVCGVTLRHIVW
jgi:hypothetical protein